MLGLHMYTVKPTDTTDVETISHNGCIISISDGNNVNRQYGPRLTSEAFEEIQDMFSNNVYPLGPRCSILWHVLDLLRLGNVRIDHIYEYESFQYDDFTRIHECYPDTAEFREHSRNMARGIAIEAAGETQKYFMPKLMMLKVNATFIRNYSKVLPLLRMKWLEIQDTTKELQGYELHDATVTEKDRKHGGANIKRIKLIQSADGWDTHILRGTRLLVTDQKHNEQEVHIVNIKGNHIISHIHAYITMIS